MNSSRISPNGSTLRISALPLLFILWVITERAFAQIMVPDSVQSVSPKSTVQGVSGSYEIVDTGQAKCYNTSAEIMAPLLGQAFYGQDAQFAGTQPSYTLSSDGKTVLDNVTKLTWIRSPNTTLTPPVKSDKKTFSEALAWVTTVNAINYGGFSDWRLPTIKELYSLMNFKGTDLSGSFTGDTSVLTPFIDSLNLRNRTDGLAACSDFFLVYQQFLRTSVTIQVSIGDAD